MPAVFIDAHPFPLSQDMQCWADVLSAIDRDLDARGRVVTDVRFDGVDEPAYREPGTLARRMSTTTRIDLTTSAPEALIRRCLGDAAQSLRALCDETARAADLFRTQQRVATANERLAVVAGELGQLIALVQALQGPLGVTLFPAPGSANDNPGGVDDLTRLLESLLQAQQAGDHYTVADILEYDLAPFLQTWYVRFEALAA